MVNTYKKPVVLLNEELAEGVYAASGAQGGGEDCYTCSGKVVQKPATGNLNFVIQFDAKHSSTTHHSTAQTLTIKFNKPVYFNECYGNGAKYVSGSGTDTLVISYTYHNNGVDNIGLGDLKVMTVDGSWDGLEVKSTVLACNYDCDQHSHLPNYP